MSLFLETSSCKQLVQLLELHNNIFVLGRSGTGKTTFVKNALEQLKLSYHRINPLACQTKESMIYQLSLGLRKIWNNHSVPQIKKLNQLATFLEQQEQMLDETTEMKLGYIVFDFARLPELEPKYFNKIIRASLLTYKLKFRIIFICESLEIDFNLPLIPKITIPPMSENSLMTILKHHLVNDSSIQDIQDYFIRDCISTFQLQRSNITQMIKIVTGLYEKFIQPFTNKGKLSSLLQRNEYKEAKNLLLENPLLSIDSMKLVENKNTNQNNSTIAQNKQAQQTLGTEIEKITLEKIPALILVSCYYANRNPEKTDRILFKDYKKKNKRNKKPKEHPLEQNKKCTLNRLIAISQSLMSICDITDIGYEKETFNQSTKFYQQINQLVEQEYIEKIQKKDDCKCKFQCLLSEKQIYEVAMSININFYEFLYNPK